MSGYDVVTLGETMLRFTPPALRRLEQSLEFEVHVGGSESNTAVGLARLGLRVAWFSRLTDNALGRIIANTLRQQGVDTDHVVWTQDDRVGLYFLEEGRPPRGSHVIYDRKLSAMANIRLDEVPTPLFAAHHAKLLHTTGISLAISDHAAKFTQHCIGLARSAGWLVSFDVNYRAKLWSPEQAKVGCEAAMQQADIIFVPVRDARQIFAAGQSVPAEEMLSRLASDYSGKIIVMTLGAEGAMANHAGRTVQQSAFRTDEVGRLGGGDAFSAGFLYSYLSSADVELALRWGAAVAALKYSIPGDLPLIDREQAAAIVAQKGATGLAR